MMTIRELVDAVAKVHPYRLVDDGGNRVCCFCGYYRDFWQRDPKYGPGTHAAGCLWVAARELMGSGEV